MNDKENNGSPYSKHSVSRYSSGYTLLEVTIAFTIIALILGGRSRWKKYDSPI